jgi:putative alpha-1,2-mannosidase
MMVVMVVSVVLLIRNLRTETITSVTRPVVELEDSEHKTDLKELVLIATIIYWVILTVEGAMRMTLLNMWTYCKFIGATNGRSKADGSSSGTENGGNDFPGVLRPWGMVKIGPDNLEPGVNSYSGYSSRGAFSGFSMMHMSGTGGSPKYGTVSQLPVIGSISNPLANVTVERAVPDTASVGYYRAKTVYGVTVELAATSHAGFYQYTFPKDVQCNVIIDVSHILTSYRGNGLEQEYVGGSLTLYPDGHYEGSGTYNKGWNRSPDWTIYFCTFDNLFCTISVTNCI